jgi:hypothetical protein
MKRKSAVMALAVVVLSVTAVQAVPTTYVYTGNPFTTVSRGGPYTTSDSVTAMLMLAGPLAPNMSLTGVTPIAFTLSDGVQTMTNLNSLNSFFSFATGPTGEITEWGFIAHTGSVMFIASDNSSNEGTLDRGVESGARGETSLPGTWATVGSVADTGSTLSLMTLTLMALGVAARQFKRAAAYRAGPP